MAPATSDTEPKTVEELRRWLQPTKYLSPGSEYTKHLNSYVAGTGDWLRDSSDFRKWEDGAESGCLWVKGVAGSGKSVFAAATVETLAETMDGDGRQSPVLFFFFRQIVEKNHDPKYLVRDWAAQLLPYSTDFQEQLDELSRSDVVDGNEMTKVWDALVKGLGRVQKVYCVADALDEMDDQHDYFINELVKLGAQKPESIKVLLTSRPISRLENQLRHPTIESIRLTPAQIYPDIVSYISSRLDALEPRLSREKEMQVKDTICERSEGLFLYARLTMDALADGLQDGEISEDMLPTSLDQLPRDLSDVYTRLLAEHSRRTGLSQEQQAAIIQCIIQSSRPMRLVEVGSIISLLMDTTISLAGGKELVRQACGRYLEMLDDESVSVIHHSFTEFAMDKDRITEAGAFPVVDEEDANTAILKLCLQYLDTCRLTTSVRDNDNSEDEISESDVSCESWWGIFDEGPTITTTDDREIRHLRFSYPFMAYAAENLSYHIKRVDSSHAFEALDSYFVPGKLAFELWLKTIWREGKGPRPLHIAALLGLTAYARYLIAAGSAIDALDEKNNTALYYGARGGHVAIVSLLLLNGADPESTNKDHDNPLRVAVMRRRPEIVRLLIPSFVDPKSAITTSTGWSTETPLHYACANGYTEILTQFVEHLDFDDACRCLHWTASSDAPDAVATILDTGKVPIDVLIGGLSALVRAIRALQPAIVEHLLLNGANPNLFVQKDKWYMYNNMDAEIKLKGDFEDGVTAMHILAGYVTNDWHYSTRERVTECMKLLVAAGGDMNIRTADNQTTLHHAAQGYRCIPDHSAFMDDTMTELLLQQGADPNARCDLGTTPLHKVHHRLPKVIEYLVQSGASVNVRDNADCTPLISLIERITPDEMRPAERREAFNSIFKLLDYGADPTAEDANGRTVFHIMFGRVHGFRDLSVWKAFIKAGADLNKPNKYGKPPLLAMGVDRYSPVNQDLLQMLAAEGLQTNIIDLSDNSILFQFFLDKFEDSALQWAGIKNLLDLGHSPRSRDQDGSTLLHRCIESCSDLEILENLIRAGADPTSVDNNGNTLFHSLALSCHESSQRIPQTLKTLLEAGVRPDAKNKIGQIPLHIASSKKYHRGLLGLLVSGELFPAVNIDSVDTIGASPIHYAASVSDTNVGELLKAGADATMKTNEGLTPLHIAARGRQTNAICVLLSEYRKSGALQTIINASDANSRTAFHYACRSGRPESIGYLLSAGADFNSKDHLGRTPLHAVAEIEEEDLLWAIKDTNPEVPVDAAAVQLSDSERPCAFWRRLRPENSGFVRSKDIIEMLEIAGADLEATFPMAGDTGEHLSLMDVAVQVKYAELVNELRRRGLSAKDKAAENLIPKPKGIAHARALLERVSPPNDQQWRAVKEVQRGKTDQVEKFKEILEQRDYSLFTEFVKIGGDLRARGGHEYEYYTGLHLLVKWGHTKLLEAYFEDAARIDSVEWLKETPSPCSLLCLASKQELPRMPIIKVLVEKAKVDIYGHGAGHFTPLHWHSAGEHFWNVEAVEYLLDHGADIEATGSRGRTPLMTSVYAGSHSDGFWGLETMHILLSRGANPNALCYNGTSCLSIVRHLNSARLLLDYGADVRIGSPSPLVAAVRALDIDMARLFLETETGVDQDKCDPLYKAATWFIGKDPNDIPSGERQIEMVSLLLQKGADPFTFLSDGFSVIQKIIEEHGVLDLFWNLPSFSIEIRGKGGRTPLISACFPKWPPPPDPIYSDDPEPEEPEAMCNTTAAFKLLEMQANVEAVDDLGRTALHWMCTAPRELDESHRALFVALVSRAPNIIYQADSAGFTPLQLATSNSYLDDWIMTYLISRGCDLKAPDPTGSTVLHYLAPRLIGDKTKALLAAEKFKGYISCGLLIDGRNNLGETPLTRLLSTTWIGTLKDHVGYSRYDCLNDDVSHVMALHLFSEAEADFHIQSHQGETFLHVAAAQTWSKKEAGLTAYDQERDMLQTLEYLIKKGLDPKAEDASGRSAIDVAVACGNLFILDLFKPKGSRGAQGDPVDDTDAGDTSDEEDDDVDGTGGEDTVEDDDNHL